MPTTSELIIDRLLEWGIDTYFGLAGDGINGFFEALRLRREKIRFIHVRHEEAGALAAVGLWAAPAAGASSWATQTSPTTNALMDVSCPDGNDCWAVGGTASAATIVHSANAATASHLFTYRGHALRTPTGSAPRLVQALAWSPNSRCIASACGDSR